MCYLVTIGTREPFERVEALVGRRSPVALLPAVNPSLRSVFPERDRLFHAIAGQCSCGIVQAKKDEAPREILCRSLRELAMDAHGVRAFVHFYSGAFDTERVMSQGTIRVLVDRLADPSVLTPDHLIEIVAQRRGTATSRKT